MVICYVVWPLAVIPIRILFSKRTKFERKNFQHPNMGFTGRAHFAFEISSDGELEQIQYLLENLLQQKKRIELLYSRPSVESNIQLLQKKYPRHLKIFRLPLLTNAPWSKQSALNFLTAPILIMCRTDFWPEILLYGLTRAKKFIFISAQLGDDQGILERLVYRIILSLFHRIIPCSMEEKKNVESLIKKPIQDELDLRVLRIQHRFKNLAHTIQERDIQHYLDIIQKWPPENRLLLAQVYSSDMAILHHPSIQEEIKNKELLVCICPRKIPEEMPLLQKWAQQFPSLPPLSVIDSHNLSSLSPSSFSHFHLLNIHGFLCELYPFFHMSYIGGGFRRSIHSVLEPYLGGSRIICGPKTRHSPEFPLVLEWNAENIHLINEHKEFYDAYKQMKKYAYKNIQKEDFINNNKAFIDTMKMRCENLERELLSSDPQ